MQEKILNEIKIGNKLYEEDLKLTRDTQKQMDENERKKLEITEKYMERSLEIQMELLLEFRMQNCNKNYDN